MKKKRAKKDNTMFRTTPRQQRREQRTIRDSRERGNPSLLEGTNESEIDTHHPRQSPCCVRRDEDARVEMERAGR